MRISEWSSDVCSSDLCTHARDADSASTSNFGAFGLAECTSRSAIVIAIVSVSILPTKIPPSFCLIEPMFMESLLDDGLEHCVRDTVLPHPPLLGRSADPPRKRHSRGTRPRPRHDREFGRASSGEQVCRDVETTGVA